MTRGQSRIPRLAVVAVAVLIAAVAGRLGRDAAQAPRDAPRGTQAQPAPSTSSAGTAAGAARTAASGPARDLARDEAHGGHTLTRHVGRTDAELRERLDRERISAASTYDTRGTAERVTALAIVGSAGKVDAWLDRRGSRPNLALDYAGESGVIIGRSLKRGERTPRPCTAALVVLRWIRDRDYYVLTSYPELRR